MKPKSIKIITILLLSTLFSLASFGQKAVEKTDKKQVKIDKTKIPLVVTETYYKEYPANTFESWYGYPEFNYENDWYGYDQYLRQTYNPEYYIVEFTKEKTPHKVIYSKSGKKIATYKRLNSEIPKAVTLAIEQSKYCSWKMASEKEEIFRDSDQDNLKVYKVQVIKGTEKHNLFYTSGGELLKDKKA